MDFAPISPIGPAKRMRFAGHGAVGLPRRLAAPLGPPLHPAPPGGPHRRPRGAAAAGGGGERPGRLQRPGEPPVGATARREGLGAGAAQEDEGHDDPPAAGLAY